MTSRARAGGAALRTSARTSPPDDRELPRRRRTSQDTRYRGPEDETRRSNLEWAPIASRDATALPRTSSRPDCHPVVTQEAGDARLVSAPSARCETMDRLLEAMIASRCRGRRAVGLGPILVGKPSQPKWLPPRVPTVSCRIRIVRRPAGALRRCELSAKLVAGPCSHGGASDSAARGVRRGC